MANSALVGCWGVIVGLMMAAFLGWMGFELLVHFFTTASIEGASDALVDGVFHHKTGEFLIVVATIAATYIGVFRGRAGIARALPALRILMWFGAALNLAALAGLGGGRFSIWITILVTVGAITPLLLARWAGDEAPGAL